MIGVVLLAIPFAVPLAYLLVRNADSLSSTWNVMTSGRVGAPLFRSLLLATVVSMACAAVGTATAWLVARTSLIGRRVWAILLPLPLVIPSFIGAFAIIAAFSTGGILAPTFAALGLGLPRVEGFWWAVIVLTAMSYPYVYMPVVARLRGMPRATEESARLFGRRGWVIFFTVVLPQARGAIVAGSLLVFLYVLSDFGGVQLLRYDTLTREIFANHLLDPALSAAMALLLALLALVVVAMERRVGRQRAAVGEGVQRRPAVAQLGWWHAPAQLGLFAVVGFALLGPILVLVYWATKGITAGSTRERSLVANPSGVIEPIVNTAVVSVTAALVTVAIVLPIAHLTQRHRTGIGSVVQAIVVGGFALPGLVAALALAYWTLRAPGVIGGFYQTLPLLITAYVIHHGALALRAAQVAVGSVPRSLEETARTLGGGRIRRLFTVELPLMMPGLAAAAGLVLLSVMKELPATLLLSPPGFSTLATRVWGSAEEALLADASIAGLVLVAVSAILTWLLMLRPARDEHQ